MEVILEPMEPTVLSVPNLRRIQKRGDADANRVLMLQITVFCTEVWFDLPLAGKLNQEKNLKEFMSDKNVSNGRRALSLTLPPVWVRDGVNRLDGFRGDCLAVTNRFSGVTVLVPVSVLPSKVLGDLVVKHNYSAARATIILATDPDFDESKGCRLAPYFADVVQASPAPMALMDGTPAATPPTKRPRLGSPAAASDRMGDSIARELEKELLQEPGLSSSPVPEPGVADGLPSGEQAGAQDSAASRAEEGEDAADAIAVGAPEVAPPPGQAVHSEANVVPPSPEADE